ncbi:hypothetical protein X559_1969 [Paenilisteria newyorkensis]|nr:hypothetical protein X559_1969 [Listeria newyorkensis]
MLFVLKRFTPTVEYKFIGTLSKLESMHLVKEVLAEYDHAFRNLANR